MTTRAVIREFRTGDDVEHSELGRGFVAGMLAPHTGSGGALVVVFDAASVPSWGSSPIGQGAVIFTDMWFRGPHSATLKKVKP